ncbi:MAG TPA: sugar phosphate isomerase/epimerase family protein [Verrucomicrobiae bacterium]|jgi:sugar phosphate isomerase/epimerase|nr:sugar phosphate isomerase/epimerase family protein [Verrucomicrobiae bacterium]
MKTKLSCADFSFPLLSHDAALKVIALLGLRGVDIGLFANRSHLRPEIELRNPEKSGANLGRRLSGQGLVAADIFLQVHDNFTDYAVNHPDPTRRTFARRQFLRALDYAAAAGSKHITILPGVIFKTESRSQSLARAADELLWRVERAARVKLTVAIEPHLGSLTDTPERALRLAALAPGFGFTLDYAHFTRAGIPDSRIEPLAARATHFHARCARKGRLQCQIKENTIDFERALAALNRHRFSGWIALEYVWIDWEHCNEVDVLSETIQLARHLTAAGKNTAADFLQKR